MYNPQRIRLRVAQAVALYFSLLFGLKRSFSSLADTSSPGSVTGRGREIWNRVVWRITCEYRNK